MSLCSAGGLLLESPRGWTSKRDGLCGVATSRRTRHHPPHPANREPPTHRLHHSIATAHREGLPHLQLGYAPYLRRSLPFGITFFEYVQARFGTLVNVYVTLIATFYMFIYLAAEFLSVGSSSRYRSFRVVRRASVPSSARPSPP